MSNTYVATTPKRKVKKLLSNTKNVLTTVNPEIFATSPRPGGYLKIMVPAKSQDCMPCRPSRTIRGNYEESDAESSTTKALFVKNSHLSNTSSISHNHSKLVAEPFNNDTYVPDYSKEFRLTRTIEETDWDVTAMDETEALVGISNSLQDGANMLAVTISCMMLMAAQTPNIPEEYLIWARNYLSCIKDEKGNLPPNIKGILSEIKKLSKDKSISSSSSDFNEEQIGSNICKIKKCKALTQNEANSNM